jgi:hypothetical protein
LEKKELLPAILLVLAVRDVRLLCARQGRVTWLWRLAWEWDAGGTYFSFHTGADFGFPAWLANAWTALPEAPSRRVGTR